MKKMKKSTSVLFAILFTIDLLTGQDTLIFSNTYTLKKDFYKTSVLILQDGVKISTSDLEKIKIECDKSFIGSDCQIIGYGKDGNPGQNGANGREGARASDATERGGNGGTGENGENGVNLEINKSRK